MNKQNMAENKKEIEFKDLSDNLKTFVICTIVIGLSVTFLFGFLISDLGSKTNSKEECKPCWDIDKVSHGFFVYNITNGQFCGSLYVEGKEQIVEIVNKLKRCSER